MLHDVGQLVGGQPGVQRHQHSARCGQRGERLEVAVPVGRQQSDAIPWSHSERHQAGGEAVAPFGELGIVHDALAVDHRDPVTETPAGVGNGIGQRDHLPNLKS